MLVGEAIEGWYTRPVSPQKPYRESALCFALSLGACSPYAIIERRSRPPIEARIIASDASTMTLEQPTGRTLTIGRDHIIDIDHPGNVAMALGLPNTVVGSLFAVITVFMLPAAVEQGWPEDGEEQPGAAAVALGFGILAAVNLAIGLPSFLWGSDIWFTSTGHAQPAYDTSTTDSVQLSIGPGGMMVRF